MCAACDKALTVEHVLLSVQWDSQRSAGGPETQCQKTISFPKKVSSYREHLDVCLLMLHSIVKFSQTGWASLHVGLFTMTQFALFIVIYCFLQIGTFYFVN